MRPVTTASSASQILESFVTQTTERLRAAMVLGHGGEVGRAREQALRDLLRSFLPPSLGVTTGFVIDAHGGKSRQMDIIIHFADYHAVFTVGDIPLVPVEAVIAVIEVKSNAASTAVLRDCYDNLATVKALDRSNSGRNVYLVDREPCHLPPEMWRHFQFQVFACVLAVQSLRRESWLDTTSTWCEEHDQSVWPNFYCGIDDYIGTYLNETDGRLFGSPNPTGAVQYAAWNPAGETPLAWAVQEVLNFVRVARRVDYRPTSYLSKAATPDEDILTRPV